MRMYPCINLEYGSELEEGYKITDSEENKKSPNAQSVYDDTLWY